MFAAYRIGYSRDVDSDVQDPPGRPAAEADEHKGLRALFRKPRAEYPDADDSGVADPHPDDESGGQHSGQPGSAIARQPSERSAEGQPAAAGSQRKQAARRQPSGPLVSRPLINPRLRADPRLRVWVTRTIVAAVLYFGVMLWLGWRAGLTAAAIYAGADTIYKSKTTSVIPPAVRVTTAQRNTRRRLKVLQPAGYLALSARAIPGTKSVIDHVVVGPAGVFTLDSQRMDRRLPLRAIGGMLYHGPVSMVDRLDHAREEADHIAALLSAELGHRIRAQPAMVIYGPSIPWVIMTLKGIDVFDGGRVGTYFRRQSKATASHHLDASQIAMVFAAAARVLPPISGG